MGICICVCITLIIIALIFALCYYLELQERISQDEYMELLGRIIVLEKIVDSFPAT